MNLKDVTKGPIKERQERPYKDLGSDYNVVIFLSKETVPTLVFHPN